MGIKHVRLPGTDQPLELELDHDPAKTPSTSKPTRGQPQTRLGWGLQHHLQQRRAAERVELLGSEGSRRADHQEG